MKNKQTTYQGSSLGTIVFVIFLILKLAGIGQVATWSWWWVTAPLWIPIAIGLGISLFVLLIGLLLVLFE